MDIKPENILNDQNKIKIKDYGINDNIKLD